MNREGGAGHETTLTTLDNLQYRLQRLEYFISGSDDAQEPLAAVVSKGREHNIISRLAKLEHTWHSISEKYPVIQGLLQLGMPHSTCLRLQLAMRLTPYLFLQPPHIRPSSIPSRRTVTPFLLRCRPRRYLPLS